MAGATDAERLPGTQRHFRPVAEECPRRARGRRDPETNVTGDDPVMTGKIALAHLREMPDYYTRLAAMEAEAFEEQKRRR